MANPNISLGTINRLVASVIWDSFPQLNVTPSFLAPEGIDMTPEGTMVTMLPAMTGMVTSPEPFVQMRLVIHLIRAQSLAAQYKNQWEFNSLLGSGTIRPDVIASVHPPYIISNAVITNINTLNFSGREAGFVVTCAGTYQINSSLWP